MQFGQFGFERITRPYGAEFDRIWSIYVDSFPVYEREPKRRLRHFASGACFDAGNVYAEPHLAAAKNGGETIGGMMFGYLEAGDIPYAYSQYDFVRSDQRRKGFGGKIHGATVNMLGTKARERGREGVDVILGEVRKPKFGGICREEAGDNDPFWELKFWHRMGYKAIDPERFPYVVPSLAKRRDPLEGLMLCARPVGRSFGGKMPIDYLKNLMRGYVLGMFEGMPGSEIDGQRNPDTDPATMENKRVLELLESRGTLNLDLIPLIEIVPGNVLKK